MNIDELREIIWEHLFKAKATESIDQLAALTNQDPAMVSAAVNHEWFKINHDRVSIAYAAPTLAPLDR
jgi:hypothetical protein